MQGGEERQDRETALDHFLTSIFSSVIADFLSTCDIHLNHSSEKYNSIFWVRQVVPLLRRLIIMLHNINKGKHLKVEMQFALSARPV